MASIPNEVQHFSHYDTVFLIIDGCFLPCGYIEGDQIFYTFVPFELEDYTVDFICASMSE